MAYRVYFTDQARNDFDSIIDFIAADSPVRALSFVDELQDRSTVILSQFPNSGRIFGAARYIVLDDYIVAYDVDEARKAVFVLLVSEGHRLWQEILRERSA
jgi:plasmid stabilization system protein ParE